MNFELDDEQTQLQDSVRRLLSKHARFDQRRAIAAGEPGYSRALWQGLAELGVTALTLPPADGGFGRGAVDLLPVLQACGHALLLAPVLASCVLGATAVRRAADAATQRRVLPAVAAGERLLAWAHDESAAHHADRWVATGATPTGAGWVLDGNKAHVLFGAAAQQIVVSARLAGAPDGATGLALFLVDAGAAGVQCRPYRLVDDTPAAELTLRAVPALPLGDPHDARQAEAALQATLAAGIAAVCADMVGAAEMAFELALAHLNTRKQFGRPIGENQALRHKAAEMLVSLEMCRSMALAAAVAADRPDADDAAADLLRAKLIVGKHARLVCHHAVQMHGGIGMTEEYAVGHALRRVHVLDQLFGDSAAQARRLALMAADAPAEPAALRKPLVYLDDRAVSRDAVLLRGRRAATGMAALGVGEGDFVALLLRNDFAFFEAQQAAAALGAYCVPINWHGKADEVRYVLEDARPKVLVAHADLVAALRGQPLPPLRDQPLLRLRGQLPPGPTLLVVPTPPEVQQRYGIAPERARPLLGDTVWPDWCDGFAPWAGPPRRSRATMIYTSGTTGHPKGVKREAATPEQAAAYVALIASVYGVTPGVRALVAGPLYHASPNAYGRQALPHADVLVLQSKFDPEETLALIDKHRLTHAVMVPTMFVRLLRLPPAVRARYDVRSLRWVTHTGAPCPVDVKKALLDWWGPVVYETYGGSEVGTATLATPADWLAHPGSVGVPTPGTRMAIYGEDGKPVAPGEVGEIFMRVPAYADFTYLNHESKRASVERDGLVSCGDVGYMKDEHLYLCDRRSDMVISAGTNIYPAEIEMALLQCPGVQDCAVFGIPDDEFGEALAAAVQAVPGVQLGAEQVRGYLAARLASYKVPRRVDFHVELPREDSGKIFKRRLRDPFWQAAGRKI